MKLAHIWSCSLYAIRKCISAASPLEFRVYMESWSNIRINFSGLLSNELMEFKQSYRLYDDCMVISRTHVAVKGSICNAWYAIIHTPISVYSFVLQTLFFVWFALSGWLFRILIFATWVLPFAGPLLIGAVANNLVIKVQALTKKCYPFLDGFKLFIDCFTVLGTSCLLFPLIRFLSSHGLYSASL